jgi:uncharacterized protein (DUF427 family)
MSALIESAWPKHTGYETKHVDRLYLPVDDVNEGLSEPTPNFTVCPFKGHATYWSLTAVDPVEKDIVRTCSEPFPRGRRLRGYACFYQERVRLEHEDQWGDSDHAVVNEFPAWGDASELLRLIEVHPEGEPGHFVGPCVWNRLPRRHRRHAVAPLRGSRHPRRSRTLPR